MSSNDVPEKRCILCNVAVVGEIRSTKRFMHKTVDTGEDDVVDFSDAIKKIMEWKANGQKIYKIRPNQNACLSCGTCIGRLYSTILQFDFLNHKDSLVSNELLKDKAEDNILRYRKGILLKSNDVQKEMKQQIRQGKYKKNTNGNQGYPILEQTHHVNIMEDNNLITPDTFEDMDHVKEKIGFFGSIAMVDDLVNDPDYSFNRKPNTRKRSKRIGNGRKRQKLEQNEQELKPHIVLGVDDPPPSPRASAVIDTSYKDKKFVCQLCPKGFGTKQGLRTHLLLTHEIGEKSRDYACDVCGRSFYYEYLLKNHSRVHSNEKPVECPVCQARFKSKLSLNHHQRNVHAASDRPFQCTECGRSYKEARSLREHVNIIHLNAGPSFACKYGCGSVTKRKRSMLGHMRKCRQRPDREQTPDLTTEIDISKVIKTDDVTKEQNQTMSCKWGCGKTFKEKIDVMRHQVYNCRVRPEKFPRREPKVDDQKC